MISVSLQNYRITINVDRWCSCVLNMIPRPFSLRIVSKDKIVSLIPHLTFFLQIIYSHCHHSKMLMGHGFWCGSYHVVRITLCILKKSLAFVLFMPPMQVVLQIEPGSSVLGYVSYIFLLCLRTDWLNW